MKFIPLLPDSLSFDSSIKKDSHIGLLLICQPEIVQSLARSAKPLSNHHDIYFIDPSLIDHMPNQAIIYYEQLRMIPLWLEGIFSGNLNMEQSDQTNLCFISNRINDSHLRILQDAPLTGHLGAQKHLTDREILDEYSTMGINFMRLGELKNKLDEAEAILRDSNQIHFDLNSIAYSSSFPDSSLAGLSFEEACQLMKFIGTSSGLRAIHLHGITDQSDRSMQNNALSILLWYIIEGMDTINSMYGTGTSDDMQEYIVESKELPCTISFHNHLKSNKWWFSIENQRNLFSCSARDYQSALSGDMSNRILRLVEYFD